MNVRATLLAMVVSLGMIGAANAAPVAGQISLSGYAAAIGSAGMGASTGIDFVSGGSGSASPGVAGGLTSFGAGAGSFAGLACADVSGGCGVIKDITSFATSPPISAFLTLTTGTATAISFDLNSVTNVSHGQDTTGGSVTITASGIIHFSGLDDTAGVFSLTAQGNQITSFSATTLAVATSEPASIALLGGSLVAIGFLRRKRPDHRF